MSFLRGFFDTDGTVYCQKIYSLKKPKRHTQIRIKLSTTSKKLALDLVSVLAILKIKSFLKTQLKKEGEKTAYYVEINGGVQVDSWFTVVGSRNPKHVTKYRMWQEFGFCPPFTTLAQRKKMLSRIISPELFYQNCKNHAEVTEPGQMCKVEVSTQKPCPLVGARVRIASSASL